MAIALDEKSAVLDRLEEIRFIDRDVIESLSKAAQLVGIEDLPENPSHKELIDALEKFFKGVRPSQFEDGNVSEASAIIMAI